MIHKSQREREEKKTPAEDEEEGETRKPELNQRQLSAAAACGGGRRLTSIWGVGRGAVEEPRGARHSQVHAGVAVAIHAVADGVVARLLRGAAGDVAPGGDAAGVPAVAH